MKHELSFEMGGGNGRRSGLLGKYMLYNKVEGAEEMQQAAEQIVDRLDQRFFFFF